MAKKYGVVGITKKENAQLGLLLKYLSYQKRYLKLPEDVIQFPEDFVKLTERYSNAV